MADEKMINDNIEQVKISDACITGVPSKDTVKISDDQGLVVQTPDRSKVWIGHDRTGIRTVYF